MGIKLRTAAPEPYTGIEGDPPVIALLTQASTISKTYIRFKKIGFRIHVNHTIGTRLHVINLTLLTLHTSFINKIMRKRTKTKA